MSAVSPEDHNRETYDRLISLIENNQGALGLILVGCDDLQLRQRLIDRYEAEAKQAKIQPYRVVLGSEPSLRSGLDKLRETRLHLQQGREAVVTVTGAEWLLRVKLRPEDEQSDLDQFFGYLQWTREGLREFRYPIVLWVTLRILREMSVRAPDFWSWRKAVLRFAGTEQAMAEPEQLLEILRQLEPEDETPLPPLKELRVEIELLESSEPESANLATLYDLLGRVYAQRIAQGEATDLAVEQQQAIAAFQTAIVHHEKTNYSSALVSTLNRFGDFLEDQSRYTEAISTYQQALIIAREIGDRYGEASSLNSLGNAYYSLGQYQRAIEFHQQSLEIKREIGDRHGEANSLNGLGSAYNSLEQRQRAIEFHQQSLEIKREIGDRHGEASSLGNLGNAYYSLGQYQRAIEFHQKSLEINREIGDRRGEASSLGNLGNAYYSLGQYQRAIEFHQQSLEIKREIGDRHGEANSLFNKALALTKFESRPSKAIADLQESREIYADLKLNHRVEICDDEIYSLNQIIFLDPQSAPVLGERFPTRPIQQKRRLVQQKRPSFNVSPEFIWSFIIGIVLLIWMASLFDLTKPLLPIRWNSDRNPQLLPQHSVPH